MEETCKDPSRPRHAAPKSTEQGADQKVRAKLGWKLLERIRGPPGRSFGAGSAWVAAARLLPQMTGRSSVAAAWAAS